MSWKAKEGRDQRCGVSLEWWGQWGEAKTRGSHLEAKAGVASIRQGTRGSAGRGCQGTAGGRRVPEGVARPPGKQSWPTAGERTRAYRHFSAVFGNLAMAVGAGEAR